MIPIDSTDIVDKNNLSIQMSNLEITKKVKLESGIHYKHYQIPVREYLGKDEKNNMMNNTCEQPYNENLEQRIVEDYYRIKNASLFKQMFG